MGSYRASMSFFDRSKKQAQQYTGGAWCKKHVKTVGKDQWGNYYSRCYTGHTMSLQGITPDCEVIVEEVQNG